MPAYPFQHQTKLDHPRNELAAELQDYLHLLPSERRSEILNFASRIIERRNRGQNKLISNFVESQIPIEKAFIQNLISDFRFNRAKLNIGESFQQKLKKEIQSALIFENPQKAKYLIEIWTQFCGKKISDLDLKDFIDEQKDPNNGLAENLMTNENFKFNLEVLELWGETLELEFSQLGLQEITSEDFNHQVQQLEVNHNDQLFESIKSAVIIWTKFLKRDLKELNRDVFRSKIQNLIKCYFGTPFLHDYREVIEFWQSEMAPAMGKLNLGADFAERLKSFIETDLQNDRINQEAIWIWVNLLNENPSDLHSIKTTCQKRIEGSSGFYQKMQAVNVWKQVLRKNLSDLKLDNFNQSFENEFVGQSRIFKPNEAEMWLDYVYDPNREGDNRRRDLIIKKMKEKCLANLENNFAVSLAQKYFEVWRKFEPEKAAAISAFLQLDAEQQKSIFESAETEQQSEVAAGNIDSQIDRIRDLTAQVISERQKPN